MMQSPMQTPTQSPNPTGILPRDPKKLGRRQTVNTLLEQFSSFAHGLHDASEQDLEELQNVVRDMICQEMKVRTEQTVNLERRCAALESSVSALQKGQAEQTGITRQRFDALESTFASWADKQTRDIETLNKRQAALNEAHDHRVNVERSFDMAVKELNSVTEQTARTLTAVKSRLDHLNESVQACEQQCSRAEVTGSALGDRLEEADRRLQVAISGCSEGVEQLRNEMRQKLLDARESIAQHTASQQARAESHEEMLQAKHDMQACWLKSLQDEQGRHSEELGGLQQRIDAALRELARTTAEELRGTREEVDQIMGLLSGVQRAWRRTCRRMTSDASSPKAQEPCGELKRHLAELSRKSLH